MNEIEMEDINLDIDIDYSSDPFYTETWFLIVIAVLLLFLLVLLIRGGKRNRIKQKMDDGAKESAISTEDIRESKGPSISEEETDIFRESIKDKAGQAGEED